MTTVAVGVLARAPVAGRAKTRLLAAHEGAWVAGLYAAMLRDTLDGLQMVSADHYVVFAKDDDEPSLEVLRRHVPTPWEIVPGTSGVEEALTALRARGDLAVLVGSDAPSFPTEPLLEALEGGLGSEDVVIGPATSGGLYMIAARSTAFVRGVPFTTPAALEVLRVRVREHALTLRELPRWYQVREPSDVLTLLDEMRTNPERAPRVAQFLVTRG